MSYLLLRFFILACRATTSFFFFFNDTATTEIYTLSLHDALPIFLSRLAPLGRDSAPLSANSQICRRGSHLSRSARSEEHTSELQSQSNLVCRLLLEKKKNILNTMSPVFAACSDAYCV